MISQEEIKYFSAVTYGNNKYHFAVTPKNEIYCCEFDTNIPANLLELKPNFVLRDQSRRTIFTLVDYLKDKNRNDNVVITAEEGKQSVIETLLARGDEKIGPAIYEAWKQGARNDMIEPLFSIDSWNVALNKTGIDIKEYLEELNYKKVLPWDNIVIGTSKEELRRIYLNRVKGD